VTARNIIRARVAAAQACGYRYPHQARAAGDTAAVRAIDEAARLALHQSIPKQGSTAMTFIQSLHAQGELDDRQAAVLALTSAGFTAPDAAALVGRLGELAVARLTLDDLAGLIVVRGGKVHASYKPWTEDELGLLSDVIVAAGRKVPSMDSCRELARITGRTVKSVRSQAERILAEEARS
jgi:hypothetical protein